MERDTRKIWSAGLAAAAMLAAASNAGAAACVNGVYRAGCAGPNGAVAVRKAPYAAPPRAVVATPSHGVVVAHPPAVRCYYVNGRRVCS